MARPRKTTAPREHGFWVLLGISLFVALARFPSWKGAALALALAVFTIAAAMLVGRRIRKNPALQAAASVMLSLLVLPIALSSGASLAHAAHVTVALGAIYMAGTYCVRAILERARRAPAKSRAAGVTSIALPFLVGVAAHALGGTWIAAALAVTTVYCGVVFAAAPSAKRLKVIGLTISFAHGLSAALLILT